MSHEITGKIHLINDTQTFPSGFCKREFVITTEEKYPQQIKLESVKDGCDRLDAYQVGDDITVSFNLRGNEHNGKYYVSLQAWKFDRQAGERPPEGVRSPEYGKPEMKAQEEDETDTIPF